MRTSPGKLVIEMCVGDDANTTQLCGRWPSHPLSFEIAVVAQPCDYLSAIYAVELITVS